jgi:RNA polymerase sigma-70 factor (ECF subfamily)
MATEVLMTATAVTPADREASFDALLSAEKQRLYGIACSILRDPGEAEDAVQEAIFSAWRHWNGLRREEARTTWLIRICVNHCINRRRGLKLRLFSNVDERTAAPVDPRFDGRLVDLDRGYRALSPKQRAAVALHFHHGYTLEETGTLMRCSTSSVRTHLARAIASLRKEMTHA